MKEFLHFMYDILVPRFITEYVALEEQEEDLKPICSVSDLMEGEIPDYVCEASGFQFLGFTFFAKFGEPMTWPEYQRMLEARP